MNSRPDPLKYGILTITIGIFIIFLIAIILLFTSCQKEEPAFCWTCEASIHIETNKMLPGYPHTSEWTENLCNYTVEDIWRLEQIRNKVSIDTAELEYGLGWAEEIQTHTFKCKKR